MRKRLLSLSSALIVSLGVQSVLAQVSPAPVDEAKAKEADDLVRVWDEKGKALCEDNAPGCAASGISLERAAEAYEKAGMRNKAIATRLVILDPRYHLDYTDYGKKAFVQVAEGYQGIAEYDSAARYYESAAQKFPAEEAAPSALMDAVVLRFALGDMVAAQKDIDLFAKNYGAKKAEGLAQLYFALASTLEEKGSHAEAISVFQRNMGQIDKASSLDVRIQAHALFGRLLAATGKQKEAASEYQLVRDLYKDPAKAVAQIQGGDGDENVKLRKLAKALNAVGEALFFAAEEKRRELDAIRFPVLKGPADLPAVRKHIETKVRDWMMKKRPAIEETETAYMAIVNLQPAPPPRWVIASAARVGQMWGKFNAEFRAAPIPKEWKQNGPVAGTSFTFTEMRELYYAALDDASEPIKSRARAAFRTCVDSSVKFQWSDAYSRSCNVWLEKNDSKRFVRVDEFIPRLRPAAYFVPPAPLPEPQK